MELRCAKLSSYPVAAQLAVGFPLGLWRNGKISHISLRRGAARGVRKQHARPALLLSNCAVGGELPAKLRAQW